MKKISILLALILLVTLSTVPVFALSEEDVERAVAVEGREAVVGNIFIWLICAVAFLKASQKVDSFLSSIGVNSGRTGGGGMVYAAMVAARGVGMIKGLTSGAGGHGSAGSSSGGGSSTGEGALSGGLAGTVSRSATRNAVSGVTGSSQSRGAAASFGRQMFESSLKDNREFANRVTGTVAHGSVSRTGTIHSDTAAAAFSSYMNIPTTGPGTPTHTSVEIGGGRITGTEVTEANPGGTQYAMYSADQYCGPAGGLRYPDCDRRYAVVSPIRAKCGGTQTL